jgi:hypothetical protein
MRTVDLTGLVFGRLTVLRFVESRRDPGGHARRIYEVRCSCGTVKEVVGADLKTGATFSCGCANREIVRALRTKHGHAGSADGTRRDSSEYRSWRAMIARCYVETNIGYPNYGGRGVIVHEPWRKSFVAFLTYMGPKPTPKHTIDRINPHGHYEPGNVRWATRVQQANNTRRANPLRRQALAARLSNRLGALLQKYEGTGNE